MSAWVAGGAMLLGSGMSYLGARQSSKAIDKANAANQKAQEEANRVAWTNYLLQRGIRPNGPVNPGEIPSDYEVVNARLPLWAKIPVRNANASTASAGRSPTTTDPRIPRLTRG